MILTQEMTMPRKYIAIAALGAGLALATALPASAQGPGYVRWPTGECCSYGYATYHPWGYAGHDRPYYYVFYHRPYSAYVDGYFPRHHTRHRAYLRG